MKVLIAGSESWSVKQEHLLDAVKAVAGGIEDVEVVTVTYGAVVTSAREFARAYSLTYSHFATIAEATERADLAIIFSAEGGKVDNDVAKAMQSLGKRVTVVYKHMWDVV